MNMNKNLEGVTIHPLSQFFDERGKVMKMISVNDSYYENFGEIYFSTVKPNVVKAWHIHKVMTLNYVVVYGEIKIVLFDNRQKSKTFGEIQEIYLSPENYKLVSVPPGIWNGFKGISESFSIVANCATHPHSIDEIDRIPFNDPKIPYSWEVKNK